MREYLGSLGALVAGAVLMLVGYAATWAIATVPVFAGDAVGGPASAVALSGRELTPIGFAAGWVALAGAAGLLATRTWGRRVIGAVVALAAATAGATALAFPLTGSAFIEAALDARSITGVEASAVTTTAWWIAALIGALLGAVAGVLALLRGPTWPRLSGRYERASGGQSGGGGAGDPQDPAGAVGGIAAWDALDRGEDPTDPAPRAG